MVWFTQGAFFTLHGLSSLKPRSHASPLPIALRPAADTSFGLLDGCPILFSENNQKIYELNQVGAYIWCSLLERKTIEAISNDLGERGIDGSDAHQLVRHALQQWLDLALLDIDWELSTYSSLQTRLAQHTISIHSSHEHLLNRL